jgi:hypothetical protein
MIISDVLIRDRAYQLWLKAGPPTGQNRILWDHARAELEQEQSGFKRKDNGTDSSDDEDVKTSSQEIGLGLT